MIVTLDGPAGAGKSTAARALAQRLGFEFLDTGAMYRAVALAAARTGVDVEDAPALARLVSGLRLEMRGGQVMLDGEDVSGLLRTVEITRAAGKVAVNPDVRRRLVDLQRAVAAGRDMVCEGRDQGTVAFPEAGAKFFLFADPEERARRRHRELVARGEAISFEEVLRSQDERDRRDAERDVAPMVPAADAVLLDSTRLTLDQVVATMEAEVRRRLDVQPE